MNVKNVAQFATKVMTKAHDLPELAKVGIKVAALGGVFGGGMLAEKSLVGDEFKKVNARLDALEQSNPNNENVQPVETKTTKETARLDALEQSNPNNENVQPVETKTTKETGKGKKENQVQLIKPNNYIEPELSENGRIDTSYYDATRTPRFISYKDKPAGKDEGELRTVREEAYETDGKMMHYRVFNWSNTPKYGYYEGKPSTITYDYEGDILDKDTYYNYGREETHYFKRSSGVKDEITWKYNDEGHMESCRRTDSGKEFYSQYAKYNPDGTSTLELTGKNKKEIQKNDKNGKILERKRFGKNGILQYTITPKYNKDGDLIKNDTVWNK